MNYSKLTLAVMVLASSLQAFSSSLKVGTYFESNSENNLTIYIKDVPGRSGSFLALITKSEELAHVYLVDNFIKNKFGMIPLKALDNNVVGAANHTPALVLSVSEDGSYDRITITPNAEDNKLGFSKPMDFRLKEKTTKTKWINNLDGVFSLGNESRAATVTAQDTNHEASLSIKTGALVGDYSLRESRSGLHLVLKTSLTTMGVEVSEQTKMIAVFTEEGGRFSKDRMLLINSETGAVTKFEKQ